MEDRVDKDIGGIVDNLNEMNQLVENVTLEAVLASVDCFPETPIEWYPIILKVAERVANHLTVNGFEQDDVVYDQIKEKFGMLRIYFTIPKFFDDEISDEMYDRLNTLSNEVGMIIMDAEEEVKKLSLTSSIY